MNHQKLLVQIVAIALGVAAVCGAGMVLMGRQNYIGQMIGTLAVTAIIAALMLGTLRSLDPQKYFVPFSVAMGLLILELLLILFWIWEPMRFPRMDETMAGLVFSIAGTGVPVVICLRFLHTPAGRWACWFGLIVWGVAFCTWMIDVIGPRLPDSQSLPIFLIGDTVAGFGTAGALSLIGLGTDRRYLRYAGFATAIAAMFIGIWQAVVQAENIEPLLAVGSAAVALGIANALAAAPLKPGQRWVAWATTAVIVAGLLLANLEAVAGGFSRYNYNGSRGGSEFCERGMAACGILAACGLMVVAVFLRTNRGTLESSHDLAGMMHDITVTCPVCEKSLTTKEGSATCDKCRVQIFVRIEEPRCAMCGYSLLMNPTDRCPECGTLVNAPAVA